MQLPDGANVIVVGRLGNSEKTLAFVGGNCSIVGFDHTGEDLFWTVSDQECLIVCFLLLVHPTSCPHTPTPVNPSVTILDE